MSRIGATQTTATSFSKNLRRLNGFKVNELQKWLFLPGMKFGDSEKWWSTGRARPCPHEGLDILMYLDGNGDRHYMPVTTRIPPLLSGVVVATTKDFLGETVILAHDLHDRDGGQLHTFYAHLQPAEIALNGKSLPATGPIGRIAKPTGNASGCPAHLHLSLAWVGKSYPIHDFLWDTFYVSKNFRPADPLAFISEKEFHNG